MGYTVAQVAGMIREQNAALARIERLIIGGQAIAPAQASAPAAASVVAMPDRDAPTGKVGCSLHLDHKDGKGFSPAGMVSHRAWCVDGKDVAPRGPIAEA